MNYTLQTPNKLEYIAIIAVSILRTSIQAMPAS